MKTLATVMLITAFLVGLGTAAAPAADNYKVDAAHSFVVFKIRHLGVSNAWGRFNNPSGVVIVDEQDPTKSKFDVEVKAAGVDTGNEKRDAHLKNPDFFNSKQFPTIGFKSDSVKRTGDNTFEVSGQLTLHGTTRPITVSIERIGAADTQMGSRAGFETSFTIKRSDYGMTNLMGPVGDDVTIWVSIEGVKG